MFKSADTFLIYMICADVLFLGLFVAIFSLYQRRKLKKSAVLSPGAILEYRNIGARQMRRIPQIVIHSANKDYYLTRIQSRDRRFSSKKLYKLRASDLNQYFSLAS